MGRRLTEAGISPCNIVQRSQFPDVILQWVLEGRGIALLFETTTRRLVKDGSLVRIGPPIAAVGSMILAKPRPRATVLSVVDFVEDLLAREP
jgi:DNA-binding transcriptional LysR family regulator